ncbi:MAG: hypothetical protein M1283_02100 [Gammaproteobacteria bacterium]|nr:hypothetical protein [Gammaproteobacteria bacterium]
MKEIVVYLIAAIAGLTILGYSVHMLIGGLVSRATEYTVITLTVLVGVVVLGFLAWDVVKRRVRSEE